VKWGDPDRAGEAAKARGVLLIFQKSGNERLVHPFSVENQNTIPQRVLKNLLQIAHMLKRLIVLQKSMVARHYQKQSMKPFPEDTTILRGNMV